MINYIKQEAYVELKKRMPWLFNGRNTPINEDKLPVHATDIVDCFISGATMMQGEAAAFGEWLGDNYERLDGKWYANDNNFGTTAELYKVFQIFKADQKTKI